MLLHNPNLLGQLGRLSVRPYFVRLATLLITALLNKRQADVYDVDHGRAQVLIPVLERAFVPDVNNY